MRTTGTICGTSSVSPESSLGLPQLPPQSPLDAPHDASKKESSPHPNQQLTARNDLGALKRKPSDLRRYLAWSAEIKAQHGSILNYICQHRLQWPLPSFPGSGVNTVHGGPVLAYKDPRPFADPEDYRILRNDWPYGLKPGISHLIVWLRTPFEVKSDEGHLTEESRGLIERFVREKFVNRLAEDGRFSDPESHVLWFKNWVGLQSVRALEHVHILVRDVPEEILYEWSGESQ